MQLLIFPFLVLWTCRIAVQAGITSWEQAEAVITLASNEVVTKQAIKDKIQEGCNMTCPSKANYLELPEPGLSRQSYFANGELLIKNAILNHLIEQTCTDFLFIQLFIF